MLVSMELNTQVITAAIADLTAAATPVLTAGMGVAILFFGIPFLWRKVKGVISS